MVDQVELLPCPFCGKTPALVNEGNGDHARHDWDDCPCDGLMVPVDEWNTRTAYNPNERLTPTNHEPLGGDDLVMRLMYALHAHVPEDQRPMSMSDLSDEQAARARAAVHAVLTEWESAKAALRPNPNERLREALEAVIAQLDEEQRVMVEERSQQYGSGFTADQRACIEEMFRNRRIGADLLGASLARTSPSLD